ncbi:glycoside hydrolase family 3 N-terminal domain-containing protein [Actinomycetota bacterium]
MTARAPHSPALRALAALVGVSTIAACSAGDSETPVTSTSTVTAGTATGSGVTAGSATPSASGGSDSATSQTTGATSATTTATSANSANACVTETFTALSKEQRVGQLLMIAFQTGSSASALDATIASTHAGNVIYLGGWEGADNVTATSAHLQQQATKASTGGIPLLIAADQEGGEVQQLRGAGFTRLPSAKVQAQMTPAQLTQQATTWAGELKRVGINVNLAPVTDTVPEEIGRANKPIGKWGRQYGSDPATVSKAAVAFMKGMDAGGVQSVVKHFPGLGRITENTDFSSTGISDTVATKSDPYLAPFKAGIDAGASMVMVGSAHYPKLDGENPAMFSRAIITDLLRGDMGYTGVVVTDDVNAQAVRSVAPADRAVRLLDAGGDIVLTGDPSHAQAMSSALLAKAGSDKAFAAKVDASVGRVLALKDRMGMLECSAG